jgi:hypothetical protein
MQKQLSSADVLRSQLNMKITKLTKDKTLLQDSLKAAEVAIIQNLEDL